MDNGSGWIDGGEHCARCIFRNYARDLSFQHVVGCGERNEMRIYVKSKDYLAGREKEIDTQIKRLEDEKRNLAGR